MWRCMSTCLLSYQNSEQHRQKTEQKQRYNTQSRWESGEKKWYKMHEESDFEGWWIGKQMYVLKGEQIASRNDTDFVNYDYFFFVASKTTSMWYDIKQYNICIWILTFTFDWLENTDSFVVIVVVWFFELLMLLFNVCVCVGVLLPLAPYTE